MNNTHPNELEYDYQGNNDTSSFKFIIEERVHGILEQYHPREGNSNLKVNNPDNENELNRWNKGVIGLIKSEILGSGFGNFSDLDMFNIITVYLHEYFQYDPWYNKYLLNILPKLNPEN